MTMAAPVTISEEYWLGLTISTQDFEFLYNHLLEIETPLSSIELTQELIKYRSEILQKEELASQAKRGSVYLPKDDYKVGDKIQFPALGWRNGDIVAVRSSNNPELPPFKVVTVKMGNGEVKQFACDLPSHPLNTQQSIEQDNVSLKVDQLIENYGMGITEKLDAELSTNPDLVCIAGKWFPRSLLVDVSQGHLNLAEALLDMNGGGPLTTKAIVEQLELPHEINLKLTEFSLNLALQEDERFDEVGPSGETLWFLKRLEPDGVQTTPVYLRYTPTKFDPAPIQSLLDMFQSVVADELETVKKTSAGPTADITISLIYPHWRAGTLPLSHRVAKLFPTAYEAPRIRFTLVDGESGKKFSGWVVRSNRYVFGLSEWYIQNNVIPGSLIHIKKGKIPGEVIIQVDKRRPSREWIRTVLVGADGGVVFAILKQQVSTSFDERLVTFIPDTEVLDRLWLSGENSRKPIDKIVANLMKELAKLNPQGHVHAEELYAAVNIIRRCSPGPILDVLNSGSIAKHLGDLYFRLEDQQNPEGNDD